MVVDLLNFREENRGYKTTPTARKIAAEKGIPLAEIAEDRHKRIYKEDVLEYKEEGGVREIETLSRPGKRVGESPAATWNDLPHVTLTSEVDMAQVLVMVDKINNIIDKEEVEVSVTEILVKTLANSLKEYPIMNAHIEGEEIVYSKEINIGLAVNKGEEVVIPVLKEVNQKSLKEIIKEKVELIKQVEEDNLTQKAQECNIILNDLGDYGVDFFTSIINTPAAGVLGVGEVKEKPIAAKGKVEIRPVMQLNLSFDHRLVNGAPAAKFLNLIKKILEKPELLIV